MADPLSSLSDSTIAPSRNMFLITPHATNEVDPLPKAIRAGGAGNIVLRSANGAADVTITVAAGEVIPVHALFIRAAGTTVSTIHGFA